MKLYEALQKVDIPLKIEQIENVKRWFIGLTSDEVSRDAYIITREFDMLKNSLEQLGKANQSVIYTANNPNSLDTIKIKSAKDNFQKSFVELSDKYILAKSHQQMTEQFGKMIELSQKLELGQISQSSACKILTEIRKDLSANNNLIDSVKDPNEKAKLNAEYENVYKLANLIQEPLDPNNTSSNEEDLQFYSQAKTPKTINDIESEIINQQGLLDKFQDFDLPHIQEMTTQQESDLFKAEKGFSALGQFAQGAYNNKYSYDEAAFEIARVRKQYEDLFDSVQLKKIVDEATFVEICENAVDMSNQTSTNNHRTAILELDGCDTILDTTMEQAEMLSKTEKIPASVKKLMGEILQEQVLGAAAENQDAIQRLIQSDPNNIAISDEEQARRRMIAQSIAKLLQKSKEEIENEEEIGIQ